jgi:hypothetical protein
VNALEALDYALNELARERDTLDRSGYLNRGQRRHSRLLGEAHDALTHLRDLIADPERLADVAAVRAALDREFTRLHHPETD